MNAQLEFVEYTKEFLALSWDWLNDPEIKALTMTPDFTKEDQAVFFGRIPFRDDIRIYGMCVNGEKAGACGLKNISPDSAEFWCYIGLKKFWGVGLSVGICRHIEAQGRKMNIPRIYLKTAKINLRSIRAWEKLGFSVIEELPEYFLMTKQISK